MLACGAQLKFYLIMQMHTRNLNISTTIYALAILPKIQMHLQSKIQVLNGSKHKCQILSKEFVIYAVWHDILAGILFGGFAIFPQDWRF